MHIIGRQTEQSELRSYYESERPEFLALYGRRRVGKTFLIREFFHNDFTFYATGLANAPKGEQLQSFADALRLYGLTGADAPKNWLQAFGQLRQLLERSNRTGKKVIFIDEMPWFDTPKSGFISALEHFWNGWASGKKDIKLILCGSAASWITKKIFRNKGGLYNRTTRQIRLRPFTLAECEEYLSGRGVTMNTHDLIESYMIFGGIPYYLRMMERKYSLALNVDRICFAEDAPLRMEFDRLMDTLFASPEKHVQVLEALHTKKRGLTREDIAGLIDFGNGGNLTRILQELAECGFIRKYKPFGKGKNGALYQLSDPFISFHLDFIRKTDNENFWSAYTDNAGHRAWSGYAFEQTCLAHADRIKAALGISGVLTDISSWRGRGEDGGAQIDLVIDRNDGVINLCEIKYANAPYEITRAEDLALRSKLETFRRETKTRKALHLTMITTYGVKPGKYAGIVQSEVSMDELLGG